MLEVVEISSRLNSKTRDFLKNVIENELELVTKIREDIDEPSEHYQTSKSSMKIALSNGEVVGTCGLLGKENNNGYLKRMYVKKELRGQGLGNELFIETIKQAKIFEIETLYLTLDAKTMRASEFYSRHGFEFVDKNSLPFDIPIDEEDLTWMKAKI